MFKFKMLTKVLVAVIFFGRVIELNLNLCIALSIDLANPANRNNVMKAWQSRDDAPDEFHVRNNEDFRQRNWMGPSASLTFKSASSRTAPVSIQKPTTTDHQDDASSSSGQVIEHTSQLMQKLESNGQSNYFGTILVGEKQIPFKVLFDLSSTDFWLISSECKLDNCLSRQRYNSAESASHRPDSRHINLTYNSCTKLEGRVSRDSIQFAGATLDQQAFGEIVGMSDEHPLLDRLPVDGFIGLGFKSQLNSDDDGPVPLTPFEQLHKLGLLREAIFSLEVRKEVARYNYSAHNGELLMGEISSEYTPEELTYVPVTHTERWEFHLTSVNIRDSYGANGLERACESTCPAVLDTRIQFLGGHHDDVDRLNRAIGGFPVGDGLYRMSHCDLSLMPYLVFTIGGTEFALAPEEYVDVRRIRNEVVSCHSALVAIDSSKYPHWILGEYFMKRHYLAFDYGRKRIGFARSKTMAHQHELDMYGRFRRKLAPIE